MKLGDRIHQRRRTILPPISMKELAKKACVTELTVENIENMKNTNPSVKTVAAIKGALNFFETQDVNKEWGIYKKNDATYYDPFLTFCATTHWIRSQCYPYDSEIEARIAIGTMQTLQKVFALCPIEKAINNALTRR